MSLSKETIKKLRLIQKCILAEPKLYDQGEAPTSSNNCETPCCIEGWAAWVNNPTPEAYSRFLRERSCGGSSMVSTLGVTLGEANRLYGDWPPGFEDAWNGVGKKAAAAGAKRIDLFIKSGGEL